MLFLTDYVKMDFVVYSFLTINQIKSNSLYLEQPMKTIKLHPKNLRMSVVKNG